MITPAPKKEKIVVITGPTAVGKTALSVTLAKKIGGEIISADSRQVYRGLDIGSGKVTQEEMGGVPHHLLDVADPSNTFTANEYVTLGRIAIEEIVARGKVPIIVGGTGFYIDALLGNTSLAGVPPNPVLREKYEPFNLEALQEELKTLDPERYETIEKQNRVRLVRAIEIATAIGKTPPPKKEEHYDALWIGLTLPKDELTARIEKRLTLRLDEGMREEAKNLHAEGLSYKRMEELGLEYRYMARHLAKELSYEEMQKQLLSEIKKYAKRQTTWLKRNKDIHWFAPTDIRKASELTENFLR